MDRFTFVRVGKEWSCNEVAAMTLYELSCIQSVVAKAIEDKKRDTRLSMYDGIPTGARCWRCRRNLRSAGRWPHGREVHRENVKTLGTRDAHRLLLEERKRVRRTLSNSIVLEITDKDGNRIPVRACSVVCRDEILELTKEFVSCWDTVLMCKEQLEAVRNFLKTGNQEVFQLLPKGFGPDRNLLVS